MKRKMDRFKSRKEAHKKIRKEQSSQTRGKAVISRTNRDATSSKGHRY